MTYVVVAVIALALAVLFFLFRRKRTPKMPSDVYPGQIKYAVCEAMLKGMSNEEILEQQIGGIASDGSRGTKAWDDTLYYIEGLRNRLRECNPWLKI